MKKASTWALIIGIILIGFAVVSGSKTLVNPTNLPLVNIATNVYFLLEASIGLFLVLIFVHTKKNEDFGHTIQKPEIGSHEDIALMSDRRSFILGFILIIEFWGSSSMWILNNYTAGLTLTNVFVIVDVLFNAFFLYVIVQLFKKNMNILSPLLYSFIAYNVIEGILYGLNGHWYGAILGLLITTYFAFAIKAPLNRKNFRIAHLIALPVLLILTLAGQYFDNGNIIPLQQNEALVEQQYANNNSALANYYVIFLQNEHPTASAIQDIVDAKERRDKSIQDIKTNITALESEFEKQLPSIKQKKTLENYRFYLELVDINQKQGDKVAEFMNYAKSVNFNGLTTQQVSEISSYKKQILDFQDQLTQVQSQWNNANLN